STFPDHVSSATRKGVHQQNRLRRRDRLVAVGVEILVGAPERPPTRAPLDNVAGGQHPWRNALDGPAHAAGVEGRAGPVGRRLARRAHAFTGPRSIVVRLTLTWW